jgi:hypothetical protein
MIALPDKLRARVWMLAVPLVVLWSAGTAYAFWYFELADLRPFAVDDSGSPVAFDAAPLRSEVQRMARSGAPATLVHFWDPACPCSRFNVPHVRELVAAYRDQGVRFVAVVSPGAAADKKELAARAAALFGAEFEIAVADGSLANIPASPAAMVVDGHGRLAYLGPYGLGAACGAGSERFVERAMELALAGTPPGPASLSAVGCYCRWPAG